MAGTLTTLCCRRARHLFGIRRLIEIRHLFERGPQNAGIY